MKRKLLVFIIVGILIGGLSGCGPKSKLKELSQKLVILGFDGADPRLTEEYMAAGILPHLQKIKQRLAIHKNNHAICL